MIRYPAGEAYYAQLTYDVTLGAEELQATEVDMHQVLLYPNPNTGTFTIQLGAQWLRNGKPVFDVYDATGRLTHANLQNTMNGSGNYEVELGNPSKGVRFLRIRSADGSLDVTRSILVQ